MTPDVKRLREILARLTAENANNADDALTLTEAIEIITAIIGAATPPDGAAEREADEGYRLECGRCEGSGQFPEGRTCLRCGGNGYDPVQPKPTPAPTEAPAAAWSDSARVAAIPGHLQSAVAYLDEIERRLVAQNIDMRLNGMAPPSSVADILREDLGLLQRIPAALAARPAAVTDEMVEAARRVWDLGERRRRNSGMTAVQIFDLCMKDALTAALAARGPA